MKRISLFIIVFLMGMVLPALAAKADKKTSDRMVRVAIVRDAREIDLAIEGQYTFLDMATGQEIAHGPRQAQSTVRLLNKGIFIGMSVYPVERLLIQPLKGSSIVVNKRKFRGNVILIRTSDSRLTAVNSINIEDYIKGVLYHEVSHHWPMEALKAQAVAARTYALYSMGIASLKDYDVTNDIYSQVYGGQNSERYRTGLAVDRTAGEILAYKGQVLPSYFHATCGGMTEDAKELWGGSVPPLQGVPCMFCKESPHMYWKKNFRLKDIQDELNRRGHKIGLIRDIAVVSRNRSGRIDMLRITGRDGKTLDVKGKDFRQALGPNVLKSNTYEIDMQGYYVNFIGKGWGHGVGMCQWGARGMSLQQFNYKQILEFYYPTAKLVDYHSIHDTQDPKSSRRSVLPRQQ